MATRLCRAAAMAAAAVAAPTCPVSAQPCTPEFSPRFVGADVNSTILTLLPFNDGSGMALYAGGAMTAAGGIPVNRIARWSLDGWEAVGNGFNSTVNATIIFNGQLHAAGAFTTSGALPHNRIARWNGSAWEPLDAGLNNSVNALAVFDEDGAGPGAPSLFAGGDFTTAGGIAALRIARWNGAAWSAVGAGCDHNVEALHAHSDGTSQALYLSGQFANAGGVLVNRIAKWDGSAYSALGSGTTNTVWALGSFDADGVAGLPPALIAGGEFTSIGGVSANRIARWNGSTWADMGAGVNNTVTRMTTYNDDGAGEDLYIAGSFTTAGGFPANRLARWDGAAWTPVNTTGFSNVVWALAPFDDGRGPRLIAGGQFGTADGQPALRIASWDGEHWSGLERGMSDRVEALGIHDDGSGPAVYAAGNFNRVDNIVANQIVRFDDGAFTPLGEGIDNGSIFALASYDEGAGPRLFAAGTFTIVEGLATTRIARWDGSDWTPLIVNTTNGVNNTINAMQVWNDGSGPELFAAGAFTSAGGSAVSRVAKWDGSIWSPLGGGVNSTVNALAVHNDGSGEALYAAGVFTTAGGIPVQRIARWNGTAWADVGGGFNNTVNALASYSGLLYAGGTFTIAGGATSVNRIAAWNGTAWADVGAGVNNTISSLAVFDENGPAPAGQALFAAGFFTTAGGVTVDRIARWDGSDWSRLGTLTQPGADNTVLALATLNVGPNAGLYAGGDFTVIGGQPSAHFARFSCPGDCYANCDGSTIAPILNVADFSCFLQQFAGGQAYANCDQSTIPPVLNVADFSCFLQRFAAGCP